MKTTAKKINIYIDLFIIVTQELTFLLGLYLKHFYHYSIYL